jgi:hypothetical protein
MTFISNNSIYNLGMLKIYCSLAVETARHIKLRDIVREALHQLRPYRESIATAVMRWAICYTAAPSNPRLRLELSLAFDHLDQNRGA